MNFSKHRLVIEKLVRDNASAILTGVGVVGTVGTAVLTGRASFKAAELIDEEESKRLVDHKETPLSFVLMNNTEKAKLVWPLFVPPVGCATATIAAIIMSNRISSKRAAALAVAYGLSEKRFEEYKEKVLEKFGEKKEQSVKDAVAQEKVTQNPPSPQVIIAGDGDVLCYDSFTGRYFMSTIAAIEKAVNRINHDIIHHMYASLSSFYQDIGLPSTSMSDDLGWNTEHYLELSYSTTITADNRPCIVIDFSIGPVSNYTTTY